MTSRDEVGMKDSDWMDRALQTLHNLLSFLLQNILLPSPPVWVLFFFHSEWITVTEKQISFYVNRAHRRMHVPDNLR